MKVKPSDELKENKAKGFNIKRPLEALYFMKQNHKHVQKIQQSFIKEQKELPEVNLIDRFLKPKACPKPQEQVSGSNCFGLPK